MTLLKFIALVSVCLALSACVFPSQLIVAPKVTGVLLDDGEPVEDAEIFLTTRLSRKGEALKSADNAEKLATRTGRDGSFSIGPVSTVALVPFFGDAFLPYTLIIDHKGERYLGFTFAHTNSVPPEMEGTCDIAKPKNNHDDEIIHCDHSW